MIFRHCLKCPGCNATIVLRISAGVDNEQPFYFVCNRCNAATRGKLLVSDKPSPSARLELESGTLIEEPSSYDQAITLHPDLPSFPNAAEMHHTGGSPFLFMSQLLGNSFEAFMKSNSYFRQYVDSDWIPLKRLIGYYLDRNWQQFDIQGKQIVPSLWPQNPSHLAYHDVMHRLLEIMCMPLLIPQKYYLEMKEDWNIKGVNNAIENHPSHLFDYLKSLGSMGETIDLQRDLFHCVEMFINYKSSILPALPLLFSPDRETQAKHLRLFRDEFPMLRDYYISTFEACHKSLNYIIPVLNIGYRGDTNTFPSITPPPINTLHQLFRAENAKKAECLADLNVWKTYWPILLNRQVRNAIGHHSARHDLTSGLIVIKKKNPVPYLEFVVMSLLSIHPLLACLNALKILCISRSND